jgi:hypothetical protein
MSGLDDLATPVIGFASLLLLPALGVAALLRQRVTPWLQGAVFVWLLGGVWALSSGWTAGYTEERFLRLWLLGLVLGGGLLLVAHLRERRRTWRWIRLAMALATLAVFVRALLAWLRTYG